MKKFEYKSISFYGANIVPFLNELGKDGWELVFVSIKGSDTYYFFKREIT